MKSKRGYWIALAGFAQFAIAMLVGGILDLEDMAAVAVVQSSAGIMTLAFMVGTILIALEKGYTVVVGFLLGILGPLGLLVVALLPGRVA